MRVSCFLLHDSSFMFLASASFLSRAGPLYGTPSSARGTPGESPWPVWRLPGALRTDFSDFWDHWRGIKKTCFFNMGQNRPESGHNRILAAQGSIFGRFSSAAPRRGSERVRLRMKSAGMDSTSSPLSPRTVQKGPPFRRQALIVSSICSIFLATSNLDLISGMSFFVFFIIFGPRGAPFWHLFPAFWHHFFEYEICIDFISILGWILT